eukprot:1158787-Pelagomonas_calceolata.AAC.7
MSQCWHLWLEDHGMDVYGAYKARYKWCGNVFNCHIGTIKTHELRCQALCKGAAASAYSKALSVVP